MRSILTAPLLTAALLASVVAPAHAAKDDLLFVSRASDPGGAAGDAGSFRSSISADGRFVAFSSNASNLSDAADNAVTDVFVRDLQTNATTYVSHDPAGAPGDGRSFWPSISADGRYVAFESDAENLSGLAADNAVGDVFVRDLQTNAITYVSHGPAGAPGNRESFSPSISADGRFVAFDSAATNLSGSVDNAAHQDVFVRDLQTDTITYVSQGPAGAPGNGYSGEPSISADGRFVAFESDATNLSGEADNNAVGDVYVRDLQTNTTTRVSRASDPLDAASNGRSAFPSISADGRFVAFESDATNLSPDDDNADRDVFVRDLQTKTTSQVSRAGDPEDAGGDAESGSPSISANGRFVAFESEATNLSGGGDDDLAVDVFVRDLHTKTTSYVSRARGATGPPGNGNSLSPSISADGRFVAFDSSATLTDQDRPGVGDVFERDVLGPTSPPATAPTPPASSPSGRTIGGTSGDDVLVGTPGDDVINCGPGNDSVRAGPGNDVIHCGPGADDIDAGAGHDRIHAGTGRDRIVGRSGRDRGFGRSGNDRIAGGAGRDRLWGGSGHDRLSGNEGADRLWGGNGRDTLFGDSGRDRLRGGPGRDAERQ
jgi:Tol biopolymer transport system component